MDELFMIEKHLGEVRAVAGLQFQYEKETIDEMDIEFEHFPEPEPKEEKPKGEGEEGEDGEGAGEPEQPPEGEEGENKAPKFRVEDLKWTVTDRKPKNLP